MRYGVIADVHANLHALDAALACLSAHEVDAYLCAGDLVGYGPQPNECVRRVLDLPGLCVAGNHDLIVVDRLGFEGTSRLAQASLNWTRRALDDDVRALLAELPLGTRIGEIALHHGSTVDPREYVRTDAQARSCLDDLQRVHPGATILILGHTHRPLALSKRRGSLLRRAPGAVDLPPDEPIVLNPGAVGQSRSRDVRARVLVLDLATRVATFHAVSYDVAGCRQALRDCGLPPGSFHLPPSRRDGLADVLQAGVPRVRATLGRLRRRAHSPET
jgi:predicted phosphodiesterase